MRRLVCGSPCMLRDDGRSQIFRNSWHRVMAPLLFIFSLHFITTCSTNPYRLPTTINPIQYSITLQPNFNNFTFIGNEQILINVSSDHIDFDTTSFNDPFFIQMHKGPQMKITNVSLTIQNTNYHANTSHYYNNATQIISFRFDSIIPQIEEAFIANNGSYMIAVVNIEFIGILRDDMEGFYISTYTVKYNVYPFSKYILAHNNNKQSV